MQKLSAIILSLILFLMTGCGSEPEKSVKTSTLTETKIETQRKLVTPVENIIISATVPKMYSNIEDVKNYFAAANPPENSVAITAEQNFNFPNAILIYKTEGTYIDEIVCYPPEGGVIYSLDAMKTLLKNFVDGQNFFESFANEDATIFESADDSQKRIYAWKYDVAGNPTTFVVQEEKGIVMAFCIFQSSSQHHVPFLTSAAGLKVIQKSA